MAFGNRNERDVIEKAVYDTEASRRKMEGGEYLVSVRDNKEARLILGLELGKSYSLMQIDAAVANAERSARLAGAGKASIYRIESAGKRLAAFDSSITSNSWGRNSYQPGQVSNGLKMVDGEYLVPVMTDDEARLILGLRLGRKYTAKELREAYTEAWNSAYENGASAVSLFRISNSFNRLVFFDPLIDASITGLSRDD